MQASRPHAKPAFTFQGTSLNSETNEGYGIPCFLTPDAFSHESLPVGNIDWTSLLLAFWGSSSKAPIWVLRLVPILHCYFHHLREMFLFSLYCKPPWIDVVYCRKHWKSEDSSFGSQLAASLLPVASFMHWYVVSSETNQGFFIITDTHIENAASKQQATNTKWGVANTQKPILLSKVIKLLPPSTKLNYSHLESCPIQAAVFLEKQGNILDVQNMMGSASSGRTSWRNPGLPFSCFKLSPLICFHKCQSYSWFTLRAEGHCSWWILCSGFMPQISLPSSRIFVLSQGRERLLKSPMLNNSVLIAPRSMLVDCVVLLEAEDAQGVEVGVNLGLGICRLALWWSEGSFPPWAASSLPSLQSRIEHVLFCLSLLLFIV